VTPLAAIAAPQGFSRHGHIYVPTARERADLAWLGNEAEKRRAVAGPHWTGGFAMRKRGLAYDPWFGSDYQANITHFLGAEAEELYLPGEPASGAITGKIAGNVLSPVTSPLYRQTLSGAHLGAGFDHASYDSFDAADAGVHDYGVDTPFAQLVVFRVVSWPTSYRNMWGKSSTVPLVGYEPRLSAAGAINVVLRGALSLGALYGPVVNPGDVCAVLWGQSVDADADVYVDHTGTTSTAVRSVIGSLSSTAVFSLGSNRLTAVNVIIGLTIIFSGANAETVLAARGDTMAPWWAEATA